MIIDAHEDIAYAAWALKRDFLRSAHETRKHEAALAGAGTHEICTVGLPDLLRGDVGIVVASLFVEAARSERSHAHAVYHTAAEAETQALSQLDYYQAAAADPRVQLVRGRGDLVALLHRRATEPVLGLIVAMEGADPILTPADVWGWKERGLRQISLAWACGSRFAGGNAALGPLTADGKLLLQEMERAGLILDVSHLAEESFWQALDTFHGTVVASHSNCRSLVPSERQLSDNMIGALAERGGVIGAVFYNRFLDAGWQVDLGKEAVTLAAVVRHIDHICNLTGSSSYVGIGSDLDGGFGRESAPAEIDTVADLRKLGPALSTAGYSASSIEAILGGNWLRLFSEALPG
jgi:membrane dipeptidase